jgi:CRISPR-associated endonuclease/helicase Cas3
LTIGPFAHSGSAGDKGDWQTLEDHLRETALLAASRGAKIGLEHTAHLAGAWHDFGKHDPAFQRRLTGSSDRVDHSTAGAALLIKRAKGEELLVAELAAYAILGHHAGLPDAAGSDASMAQRLDRFQDNVPPDVTATAQIEFRPLLSEISAKLRKDTSGFDLSVVGRMAFSCLVDGDFRDTEAFYDQLEGLQKDRDWPELPGLLPDLRARFDAHMARFTETTGLNLLRAEVLAHIRAKANLPPGLFTLTVPTGGGKTLASVGFALDHAARYGHRRIIYAIPYTSIIDQTAATFRDLFGDIVLEHHSAIDTEKPGQQARDKARLAMEDWAAPMVVTTNVQLFESLFAARPSRCRKLHNIAGSVIVLDEAQSLPRSLLMPTLRMIDTLAAKYGCSFVLCTATQPAFDSRQLKKGGLQLEGQELAPDPVALASRLRRARIVQGGAMEDTALIDALRDTPQGMVIVNSRKHALELFQAVQAEGLDGAVHLTTRQYPAHRRRILSAVRQRLKDGTLCRLIATSLIEAGVDVDFPKGWRAETGLDSIVQSAGRVNREGKRPLQDSTLTVFEAPGQPVPTSLKPLISAMRSTAQRFEDLLSPEAIRDWFEQVYWTHGPERMGQPMVDAFEFGRVGTDFPYRRTAEKYRMIDSIMVPVIIAIEPDAVAEIAHLGFEQRHSGPIARALQPYTVQVPQKARALLIENGHASFHAPHLRGDQFCVLETKPLYHQDSGLRWEDAEYLGDGIL